MRARFRRFRDRLTGRSPLNSEAEAYARLARRGYSPGSIIDVGAYRGDWTKLARSIFPDPPNLFCRAASPLRPTFFCFGEEAVPGTQTDLN